MELAMSPATANVACREPSLRSAPSIKNRPPHFHGFANLKILAKVVTIGAQIAAQGEIPPGLDIALDQLLHGSVLVAINAALSVLPHFQITPCLLLL